MQLLASCATLLFFLVSRFCESNYEQIKDATLDLFGKMEALVVYWMKAFHM